MIDKFDNLQRQAQFYHTLRKLEDIELKYQGRLLIQQITEFYPIHH